MNNVWKKNEEEFIRQNAATIKDKDLVVVLCDMSGRKISLQAVRKKRRELGILKASGRGICKVK